MTDRERWTVYPLLFLTLGIAVKDKIAGRATADTLLCNTLVVHDRKGKEQVVISSTPDGGQVVTLGEKNALGVLVGHTDKLAGLMFVDGRGRLIRSLATVPTSAPPPVGVARPGSEKPEPAQEPPANEQSPQPSDEQPPAEQQPEQQKPEQPDDSTPQLQ
jgi:hypothetical protein